MAKKFENLPKSCRSKVDLNLFKEELRNYLVPNEYKFLSCGNKENCKLLTQIRVGRSYLNSHSFTALWGNLSPQSALAISLMNHPHTTF